MRTLARAALSAGVLWLGLMAGAARALPAAAAHADFQAHPASHDTRAVADWIVASGDNHGMPFVIIDKKAARVFVFRPDGRLRGESAALLGMARGDDSVPGIGERELSTIRPEERTTPAGRFVASLGADLGVKDVLWVDYADAISLHRVVTSKPKERRLQRLASPSIDDNRISYGCINVPARFYDTVVRPSFLKSSGIVYILPEVRSLASVFPAYGLVTRAAGAH
ncbi:L,D-transpeptidase [Phenylobacterium sp.]|uniref:L,D-transpeptidase n=1 Tax=Phenylobacterium sp. TaxID=1871053 RepID=UPI002DF0ED02|nr:L,D-transpeptidase [Phenylobacterium sp.]